MRVAKIQSTDNTKYRWGYVATGIHCWWECERIHPRCMTVWQFHINLNLQMALYFGFPGLTANVCDEVLPASCGKMPNYFIFSIKFSFSLQPPFSSIVYFNRNRCLVWSCFFTFYLLDTFLKMPTYHFKFIMY